MDTDALFESKRRDRSQTELSKQRNLDYLRYAMTVFIKVTLSI